MKNLGLGARLRVKTRQKVSQKSVQWYSLSAFFFLWMQLLSYLKALANEDTLLRTLFCRHKCFPVCPRAQHFLQTHILCPGHKICFWFCSETFCVRDKCFAQPKKHHGQQCVRNNVSSFTRALSLACIASVSAGLRSKERPKNENGTVFCPREIRARAKSQ